MKRNANARSAHELWLRMLVRLYPRALRERYGDDVLHLHRQLDGGRHSWLRPLFDTLRDATPARIEGLLHPGRTRSPNRTLHPKETPGMNPFDRARADLRQTLRKLRRRPLSTSLSVATLALGLGGLTAVGTVVYATLLAPLPYEDAHRVVQLVGAQNDVLDPGATIAFLDAVDIEERSETLQRVAAYDEWRPVLTGVDVPERLTGALVSFDFFDVLGIEAQHGRTFLAEEDIDGRDRVVVLQHAFWQRKFGGDPTVVGSKILLGHNPHEVVGIAPADFEDPRLSGASDPPPQLWRPLGTRGLPPERLPNRGSESYVAIARLADGHDLDAAQAEIDLLVEALQEEHPDTNAGRQMVLVPISERLVGPVRSSLLLILAGMACLLSIALLNTACLALGQTLERTRELAIRAALGAERRSLVRLALWEGLVLGLGGAACGILLAQPALRMLLALAADELPRAQSTSIPLAVLGALVPIALAVGLISALVPIWPATRGALRKRLSPGLSSGQHAVKLRSWLVAGEVAVSMVLLTGGVLLTASFHNLNRVDVGVQAAGVLTFDLSPPRVRYPERTDFDAFHEEVLRELRARPGVVAAGAINILPLSGGFDGNGLLVPGQPSQEHGGEWSIQTRTVTDGALDALGIELLEGRGFDVGDRAGSAPVTLVNRATAERFWAPGQALGAEVTIAGNPVQIVGVVDDTLHLSLQEGAPLQAYFLERQAFISWHGRSMTVAVRVDGDPLAQDLGLVHTVREVVRGVDPEVPIASLSSMQQVIDRTITRDRLRATLLRAFAGLGLLLSLIGIYGVTAYAVSTRRRELAIRLALGARSKTVLGSILRQAGGPALVGVGVGVVASWLAAGALRSFLYGVGQEQLIALGVAPFLLLVVMLATLPSGRRAVHIDPASALREDGS